MKLAGDEETVISLEDVTPGRWIQGLLTLKREHAVGRGACCREGRVVAGGVIKILVYTCEIFKE